MTTSFTQVRITGRVGSLRAPCGAGVAESANFARGSTFVAAAAAISAAVVEELPQEPHGAGIAALVMCCVTASKSKSVPKRCVPFTVSITSPCRTSRARRGCTPRTTRQPARARAPLFAALRGPVRSSERIERARIRRNRERSKVEAE